MIDLIELIYRSNDRTYANRSMTWAIVSLWSLFFPVWLPCNSLHLFVLVSESLRLSIRTDFPSYNKNIDEKSRSFSRIQNMSLWRSLLVITVDIIGA